MSTPQQQAAARVRLAGRGVLPAPVPSFSRIWWQAPSANQVKELVELGCGPHLSGFRHPGVAGEYQTEAAAIYWVAIEEFNLSYYIGETLLMTVYIYIHIPIVVT